MQSLKEHVICLLNGDGAHLNFDGAIGELAPEFRGKRPTGAAHSPWEVLEHLRIAQWDILEFTRNLKHVSPEFPAGYWPATQCPPSEEAWEKSAAEFREQLNEMIELVQSCSDLLAPIPHSSEKTVLREALLLADHNAYHLGEMVLLKRLLGS